MTLSMALLEQKKLRILSLLAADRSGISGGYLRNLDTHGEDYLETQEGKNLPVAHCIYGEDGWALNGEILQALAETKAEVHDFCKKGAFGSRELEMFWQKHAVQRTAELS